METTTSTSTRLIPPEVPQPQPYGFEHATEAFQKECKKCHPKSYLLDGKGNKGFLLRAQSAIANSLSPVAKWCRMLAGVRKIELVQYSDKQQTANPSSIEKQTASSSSIEEQTASPSSSTDASTESVPMTPDEYLAHLKTITELRGNKASHLDRDASEWKGFTHTDIKTGITTYLNNNPSDKSVIGDIFEGDIHEGNKNSIPVSVKSEYNIEGLVATHGIKGDAKKQEVTTGFLKKLHGNEEGEFTMVATSSMHPLGAGATGVNPKYPNVANVYRGKESSAGCTPCSGAGTRDRIPGGSSSGATTSVAAGVTPVAIGSDGGGSGRICPALQGVVGAKSGRGFFDTTGSSYNTDETLVEPAIIANNVTNCAKAALATGQSFPTSASKRKLKVCIDMDSTGIAHFAGGVGEEIANRCTSLFDAWQKTYRNKEDDLKIHLHKLEQKPSNVRRLARSHIAIFAKEEENAFESLSDAQRSQADSELKLNMAMAKSFTPQNIDNAKTNREAFKKRLQDLKDQGINAIFLPTTMTTARYIHPGETKDGLGDIRGALELSQFTSLANLSGTASITIPIGKALNEMPIGGMLMSTSVEDNLFELIPVAAEFENITRDNEEFLTPKPDVYVFNEVKKANEQRVVNVS